MRSLIVGWRRVNVDLIVGILLTLIVAFLVYFSLALLFVGDAAEGHEHPSEPLWSYFLGPWEIGPFTDQWSCNVMRQYQLA